MASVTVIGKPRAAPIGDPWRSRNPAPDPFPPPEPASCPRLLHPVEPDRETHPRDGLLRTEHREQPVVAAAAGQRSRRTRQRELEDEARIIVELSAEGGV